MMQSEIQNQKHADKFLSQNRCFEDKLCQKIEKHSETNHISGFSVAQLGDDVPDRRGESILVNFGKLICLVES